MKTLKLFFKFSLCLSFVLSARSAQAVELTARHYLQALQQMDDLGAQDTKSAEALFMELTPLFYNMKDLSPDQYNFVIFELLGKYVKFPQYRQKIQALLLKLNDEMGDEVYNSRQRFETPTIVARALVTGFTIVGISRMVNIARAMRSAPLGAHSTQIQIPTYMKQAQAVSAAEMKNRWKAAFNWSVNQCAGRALCKYWVQSIGVGAIAESGYLLRDYYFTTQKVHPVETLRIVQAHLACNIHWGIRDLMEKWSSMPDQHEVAKKLFKLAAARERIEKDYGALQNIYMSDIKSYQKYFPKEWTSLTSAVASDTSRICVQVSTEAMKMDINDLQKAYMEKNKRDPMEIIVDDLRRAMIPPTPYNQDPLYGYDHSAKQKQPGENSRGERAEEKKGGDETRPPGFNEEDNKL